MNNPVMMTDPDGRYHQLSQAFESSPDFNNNPQKYLIGAGGRSDSWNMLNTWAPIPTPTTLGNNAAYKDAMNFLYGDAQGTFRMTNQNGVMTWWTDLGQETQGMIGTYNMLKRKGAKSKDKWLTGLQTGLEIAGLIPGLGEFADGANTLIYLGTGDYVNAGLSAASMIPFAGWAATGSKLAMRSTNTATNVVYQGFDKVTGTVKYVGITHRAPDVRFGEHLNSETAKSLLDYRVLPGATDMSRIDARIMEQNLINQYGLENLLNVRNSIAPKYWQQYGIK